MHSVKCWQVDAFTDRPFGGNPAAVCWLEHEADVDCLPGFRPRGDGAS